jgi:hypothetical protein
MAHFTTTQYCYFHPFPPWFFAIDRSQGRIFENEKYTLKKQYELPRRGDPRID